MTTTEAAGTGPATVGREPTLDLSLQEMLRIMDVATALRQDRELVDEQLNLDALKERLRARLIEAAKVTGEDVSAAEVDAAVDRYYRRLHTFHEPPMGLQVALAHAYVRRNAIAGWTAAILGGLLMTWWLFLSPTGPFTLTGRAERRLERLSAEAARRAEAVRAVAAKGAADDELARLNGEVEAARNQQDPARLAAAADALAELEDRLREAYTVSVVAKPGEKSAIDRYYKDEAGRRVSGYYLIVEARTPDGKVLRRRVRNAEDGREEDVEIWAERVPQEVYDRLAADKKADGILDETTFAVKRPGDAEERVVIPGADGTPLRRLGQITRW